jgi:hypothetical protein
VYTNNDGKSVQVRNLPNYLQKEEELRTLGIKDLTNKADFYDSRDQNYTYETKSSKKTIT